MTATLPPMIRFQPLVAGVPLPGGKVYFYAAGTLTPQAAYAADGTTPLANPLTLDANGATDLRLGTRLAYKINLTDSVGGAVAGWPVDQIIGADGILISLADTTSAALGDALVGVKQPFTGAAARTQHDKNTDWVSVKDFGAVGDLATASLASINNAISAVNAKQKQSLILPAGDYLVSAPPTNPLGVQFHGDGAIVTPNPWGYSQLNSYADENYFPLVGKEYLYAFALHLKSFPTYTNVVQVFGDSTVAGNNQSTTYQIQNLLPYLFQLKGVSVTSVTNAGVSGTHVDQCPWLSGVYTAANPCLVILKYGINDGDTDFFPLATRLTSFATNLRAQLAAYRATYGVVGTSILLVGPSSTYNSQVGRDAYWYEQLRGIYLQAARDYKCAYFDTYAFMRDTTWTAGNAMDAPYADAQSVHPGDTMHSQIWGAIVDSIIGPSDVPYTKTNGFTNISGSLASSLAPSAPPSAFQYGISMYRATAANGWPIDGFVEVHRFADSIAYQRLVQYNSSGVNHSFIRYQNNTGAGWDAWSGLPYALTLLNSWVSHASGYGAPVATMDADGFVHVTGAIKNGTVTAGTQLAVLPNGWGTPSNGQLEFPCIMNGSTFGGLYVNGTGIYALTAINATRTSLSGIVFQCG